MVTVAQAQTQANTLSTLISSLPGPAGSDPATIRAQIQQAALVLQSMLLSLSNAASEAAQAAAGTTFDSLLSWTASTDANLRQKCIDAATSVQPINQLVRQVMAWAAVQGTYAWTTSPETAAGTLITRLATYRSITGT
jgi:hypothetical protein